MASNAVCHFLIGAAETLLVLQQLRAGRFTGFQNLHGLVDSTTGVGIVLSSNAQALTELFHDEINLQRVALEEIQVVVICETVELNLV